MSTSSVTDSVTDNISIIPDSNHLYLLADRGNLNNNEVYIHTMLLMTKLSNMNLVQV